MSQLAGGKNTSEGKKTLRLDIVAGLTAAAVVLPKAMAYATVAGLPVSVGLYTAFIPMVIYAILGSSCVLSVSSTSTIAILISTQLGLAVPDGDPALLITVTATLTALVGGILLLASVLRLGFVANFISAPVLTGFKAGIGIALMSFTESIASGRAFALRTDPPIKANRELIATGAANLGGALFGAMPAGGGTSQTAVLRAVGARSQKASLVTAGTAVAVMLVFAPLLALLPNAVLAAVVIVYSASLIQPTEFISILKIRKNEFRWALVAFFGVLVFGTLKGIMVAIVVSLIGLARQSVNPPVYIIGRKRGTDVLRPITPDHSDDETLDGLLLARPEGRMYFLNAQNVVDKVASYIEKYKPEVVVLDMSRVQDIEYTALQILIDEKKRMDESNISLWLVALNPSVLKVVRHSALPELLGSDCLLFNAREAIKHYKTMQEQRES